MHARGKSQNQIAIALGVSRGAVLRALFPERYVKFDAAYASEKTRRRDARFAHLVAEWAAEHGWNVSDDVALDLVRRMYRLRMGKLRGLERAP